MFKRLLISSRGYVFLSALILLIGLIHLTVGIGHETLWYDESYSAAMTNHSIPEIIRIAGSDSHPPLYYVMLKIFSMIFGNSESALRMLSVIGALVFAALGFGPVRRIMGKFSGFIFAFISFASPIVFSMAQESRMYTWTAVFVTGTVLYGYLAVKENKKSDWVLFAFFTLLSAYTHYYALLTVTIAAVLVFIYLIIKDRRKLLPYIISMFAVGVGYLPWIGILFSQASKTAKNFWIPPLSFETVWQAILFPYRGKFDVVMITAVISFIIAFALIVFGIATAIRKCSKDVLLPSFAIAVYILTLLAAIVLSYAIRPLFVERYIFPCIGLFFLAVVYGITAVNRQKLSLIICIMFVLLSSFQVYRIITERFNGPMKEVISYIEKYNLSEKDVFIHSNEHTLGIFAYYFPKNKHLLYQPAKDLFNPGHDAFAPQGAEGNDLKAFTKGSKNIWLVDNIAFADYAKAFSWFETGVFKQKGEENVFSIPNSFLGIKVRCVDPGEGEKKETKLQGNGNIVLKIKGMKNKKGKIVVRLFDKPGLLFKMDGNFSEDNLKTSKSVEITGSEAVVKFENMPYGNYAAFALHDENGDTQLNYTGAYIPAEGTGMTNSAEKVAEGPIPSFADAKFVLDKPQVDMAVNINYIE